MQIIEIDGILTITGFRVKNITEKNSSRFLELDQYDMSEILNRSTPEAWEAVRLPKIFRPMEDVAAEVDLLHGSSKNLLIEIDSKVEVNHWFKRLDCVTASFPFETFAVNFLMLMAEGKQFNICPHNEGESVRRVRSLFEKGFRGK